MLPENTMASSLPLGGNGASGRAFGYTLTRAPGAMARARSASIWDAVRTSEKRGSQVRSNFSAARLNTPCAHARAPLSTSAHRWSSTDSMLCRSSTVRPHTLAICSA